MKFCNPTTFIERKDPTAKWAFKLDDDSSHSDVIIMLRSREDMRAGEFHFVSGEGYVACSSNDCQWCNSGIRKQTALFLPVYDVVNEQLVFWQRPLLFLHQLESQVFDKFPNPSNFVFRFTRHGEFRSLDTHYEVTPIAKNTVRSYEEIYDEWHDKLPKFYKDVLVNPYGVEEIDDEELEIAVKEHKLTALTCSCCGASLDKKTMSCNYCGTHFVLPGAMVG